MRVTLVTKVTGTIAQTQMNAQHLKQTIVTPAHCVPTLKALTFAAALEGMRAMAESVQISMNVKVPKQMIVMLTPCVPTPKDPMCVAVLESLREMAKVAQKNQFAIRPVLTAKCVRLPVEDLLSVYARMALWVSKTTAPTSMNVKLLISMTATPTRCVRTLKDPMSADVVLDTRGMA